MSIRMNDLPLQVQALVRAQGKAAGPKRSKYGNVPTYVDGIRFDSKKEAAYYSQLLLERQAGDVLWFCRQGRFALPGGIEYVCDFVVCRQPPMGGFPYAEIVDVKSAGTRTKTYRLKKRQVEALNRVKIEER